MNAYIAYFRKTFLSMAIHIKRIYEPASKADGYRVLVDRLHNQAVALKQLLT